jgi:hypothetical protein
LQVGVVVIVALYFGKEVLIPITLAILLSFVIAPLVDLVRRTGLGRVPAVLLAVLIALSVILAIGGVIGSQVAQVANNIPQYVTTVEKKVEVIRAYTVGRIATIVGNIGRQAPGTADVQGPKPSPSRPVASVPTGQKAPVPDASSTESSPLAIAERYLFG